MRKLFWSESAQRYYSDTLDILGAEGVLAPGAAHTRSAENSNLTSGLRSSPRSTAAPARSSGRLSPNGSRTAPQPAWQLTGTLERS